MTGSTDSLHLNCRLDKGVFSGIRALKGGFYTVEAAICLPLLILSVLTIGYFIRADAVWENVMHCALDECSYSAATASSGVLDSAAERRVTERIIADNSQLENLNVSCGVQTCSVSASVATSFPLGFSRSYAIRGQIKYRDFTGLKYRRKALGAEGLESSEVSDPVWIFPQSGVRYHKESCTYVKATVHSAVLTGSVKKTHPACSLCHSGSLSAGSIVFCFNGRGTAYHRGRCRSINRHTMVIDKKEAEKRGFRPCSKCGGI